VARRGRALFRSRRNLRRRAIRCTTWLPTTSASSAISCASWCSPVHE
jgi:hypothetical protein